MSIKPSFTIDLKQAYRDVTTRITDVNGKLIKQAQFLNQTKLNLNFEGNKGIYFLNVSTEEGQANFRIVKN